MEKDSDVFDRAISYFVTFPITMLRVLFTPRTLFSPTYAKKRCPPGVALALGYSLWILGSRTMLRIETSNQAIPLSVTGEELGQIVLLMVVILIFQAFALSFLAKKHFPDFEWRTAVRYLAYPVSCTFAVWGILSLLGVHFENAFGYIAERDARLDCIDPEVIQKHGTCENWLELAVPTFPALLRYFLGHLAVLIYAWALYNVIRVHFNTALRTSLKLTGAALVTAIIVTIAGWQLHDSTETKVKELAKKTAARQEELSHKYGKAPGPSKQLPAE